MGAYFSVIQYVPDTVADERLNAGVLVFDQHEVRARFVQDWERLKRFGGQQDITHLKEFAKQIEHTCSSKLDGATKLNIEKICEMSSGWINSIQLTQPIGSLMPLDQLFDDAVRRYLREKLPTKRPRDRRFAAKLAFVAIGQALRERGGPNALEMLMRNKQVEGRVEPHEFNILVANSRPKVAADAYSFEGRIDDRLRRDIRATAYSYSDVLAAHPQIRLAVVMLEPKEPTKEYEDALRVFEDLQTEVVTENTVDSWADRVASSAIEA